MFFFRIGFRILGKKIPFFIKLADRCSILMDKIDGKKENEVSRIYLIELAVKNLKTKKTRAVVTIGGVAVGVGAIVFLVSLGYGLEKMVISRVARLDELKIIDVGLGEVSSLKMNDEIVSKISETSGVKEVIPVVSMVSKTKFRNSVLDIMAMGVDERYLKAVGAKIVAGSEFKNKDEGVSWIEFGGEVAGISQEIIYVKEGDKYGDLFSFNMAEGDKVPIWQDCSRESEMLGLVTRIEGGYVGEEIWGEKYYLGDEALIGKDKYGRAEYSLWVRIKAPLWKENSDGSLSPLLGDNQKQKWDYGCFMGNQQRLENKLEITGFDSLKSYVEGEEEKVMYGSVLGITSESTPSAEATVSAELYETVVATDSSGVEWVELKKMGEEKKLNETLQFNGKPLVEAYVSMGMLKIFGLDKTKAVGEKFFVSYIVPDGLVPGKTGRLQSEEVEYQVTGVIDDETSNYFYYQIADAKRLGIKNYSQLKVLVAEQKDVLGVRKSIDTLGLRTASTLDTVVEIEKLFQTLRFLLGLLGTIALAVASLGMFNTMTVSLLERTREVGVMKAMGMLSDDVKELFLAESMIMGVGGGLCGVLFGFVLGKILSIILSSISIVKGQGAMDISYVPIFFVLFILGVSFVVGIATGWYPSKRARQISALNALRYE
jgi:ABC-type antimicrobial peptide transport system permease subunit